MTVRKLIEVQPIINVVDIIGDLVDTIRETNTITSYSEISGVYTITSSNSLVANEYIEIDNVVYNVSSPTSTNFKISGVPGINFTSKTWKSQRPYYTHGHLLEITKSLTAKTNSSDKLKKYPLVCLIEDYESSSIPGVFSFESTLNILIVTETSKDYNTDKRYEKSFNPILTPIYNNLLSAFIKSNAIHTQYGIVDYTFIKRVYLGKQGIYGVTGQIFNDAIDAIEMKDIKVKIYKILKR